MHAAMQQPAALRGWLCAAAMLALAGAASAKVDGELLDPTPAARKALLSLPELARGTCNGRAALASLAQAADGPRCAACVRVFQASFPPSRMPPRESRRRYVAVAALLVSPPACSLLLLCGGSVAPCPGCA